MINVLIVDDQDLVRAGVKKILDDVSGIKVVGETNSGEEAIKVVRKLNPHIVLMEVKMPGIGGLEATRKIVRMDPDIKVLVLTGCDNDLYPTRFMQAGASGYITKKAAIEELIRAIRVVHSGQRYMSNDIANRLAFHHVSDKTASPFDALSERELQVMMMITRATPLAKIADSLHVSTKTVHSYRYRIYEKLKVQNDVELTLLAIRYGLVESEAVSV